ncbi:MAG: UDP pyrophosphate phosphatase [Marinobacter sp. 34-60-7]|nr:MAG: UDP pyrophosphate phosphatase [Marinobacter sp. 34-60-7]
MIGGINPATNTLLQSGTAPVRDRNDVARAPASSPQALDSASVRRDIGGEQQSRDNAPGSQSTTRLEDSESRRIDARRAAEDARLERFRADELPLPASRALNTFAGVAAAGQEFEGGSVVSGIDIMI